MRRLAIVVVIATACMGCGDDDDARQFLIQQCVDARLGESIGCATLVDRMLEAGCTHEDIRATIGDLAEAFQGEEINPANIAGNC